MFELARFARPAPLAALTSLLLLAPSTAGAQSVPSYAVPATISTDETVHGRIASVDGAFTISVEDDRGFVDHVEMHQGTIINPTGLSLSPGMSVTIAGYNAGSTFDANEIDTPYSYSGPLPQAVYYGPGYWCPGFGYGYGPSFSLAFVVGGGYDRFEDRPFSGRPWDGHRYFGGYVGRPDGDHFAHGTADRGGHGAADRGGPQIGRERDAGFGHESGNARTGERRGFAGEVRNGDVHVPAAFVGRTFAGQPVGGFRGPSFGTGTGFSHPVVGGAGRPASPMLRNMGAMAPRQTGGQAPQRGGGIAPHGGGIRH